MEKGTDYASISAENKMLKEQLKSALDQFKWAADKLAEAQHELALVKMMLVREIERRETGGANCG